MATVTIDSRTIMALVADQQQAGQPVVIEATEAIAPDGTVTRRALITLPGHTQAATVTRREPTEAQLRARAIEEYGESYVHKGEMWGRCWRCGEYRIISRFRRDCRPCGEHAIGEPCRGG